MWGSSPFRIDCHEFIVLIKLSSENPTEGAPGALLSGKGSDHVMLA